MNLIDTINTDWAIIKKDFGGFIAKVLGAVTYLEAEAGKIIGWVSTKDAGLGATLALLVHDGEVAIGTLLRHEAQGLGTIVDSLAPTIETTIANALQATGLNLSGVKELDAVAVSTITRLQATAHAAVDAGLAKVLGVLAPAPAVQQSQGGDSGTPFKPVPPVVGA